jgi:hypothetical protein
MSEDQFLCDDETTDHHLTSFFVDHIVKKRQAHPLTGCALLQYCAHCVGLLPLALLHLPGHFVISLNINPLVLSYQDTPSHDLVLVDVCHGGRVMTISEAMKFFDLSIPSSLTSTDETNFGPSMTWELILLRVISNLVLATNRATSPAAYRSVEFLSMILTLLQTEILLLVACPSIATSTSLFSSSSSLSLTLVAPSSESPPVVHWSMSNLLMVENLIVITKALKLKSVFRTQMTDLTGLLPTELWNSLLSTEPVSFVE